MTSLEKVMFVQLIHFTILARRMQKKIFIPLRLKLICKPWTLSNHTMIWNLSREQIMNDLAVSYISQHQRDLARDTLLCAKPLFENEFGTEHPFSIQTKELLSEVEE